jgi:hypothetical protein
MDLGNLQRIADSTTGGGIHESYRKNLRRVKDSVDVKPAKRLIGMLLKKKRTADSEYLDGVRKALKPKVKDSVSFRVADSDDSSIKEVLVGMGAYKAGVVKDGKLFPYPGFVYDYYDGYPSDIIEGAKNDTLSKSDASKLVSKLKLKVPENYKFEGVGFNDSDEAGYAIWVSSVPDSKGVSLKNLQFYDDPDEEGSVWLDYRYCNALKASKYEWMGYRDREQ